MTLPFFPSAIATADEFDSDRRKIIGEGSLQEVETGSVVPVGRFHADK